MTNPDIEQQLLRPAQAAAMCCVLPDTLARWADAGHITCVRTVGGNRRYIRGEIEALLRGERAARPDSARPVPANRAQG